MTLEHQLLVVDHIEITADQASADLRIGGRRERCTLGLSIPGLVQFEHMPDALASVPQAQKAVIDLVSRAHQGATVRLPVDLSDIVRQSSDPWPIQRPAAPIEDEYANSVVVNEIIRDTPTLGLITVHLRVRDVASVVVVDERDGLRQPVRFRFATGAHPWQLSQAEGSAMLTALLQAARLPLSASRSTEDAEVRHIVQLIEQDPRPWSRLGDQGTVARVYFAPKSRLDFRQMPAEMINLADAAVALGFTAELEREFGLSDSAIGGLQWLVLALGSGAAGVVALNATLKAAAELPESWRKLFDKLRAYSSLQLSAEMQLEVVHRWLDEVYGAQKWCIDYDDLLIKRIQNSAVFDFREQHSGHQHRVLVVERTLADISRSRHNNIPSSMSATHRERVDLAIVTILPEEYQAVLACLDAHEHVRGSLDAPNIYSWEIGTVRAAKDEYVVVVALAGDPTNQVGAVATQATIERFDPRYVVLVGIAGGLATQGQEHGDVVVSKTIYAYEYGKLNGGFHPRHDFTHRVDPGIANAASALIAGGTEWWKDIQTRPPREKSHVTARLGTVASGDKVVDDVEDAFFAAVIRAWPKLLAIEMEGAGAAVAIDAALAKGRQVGFAMVRAISDMPGVGIGTTERDAWKPYAAEAAARFLVALLRERWPVPPFGESMRRTRPAPTDT